MRHFSERTYEWHCTMLVFLSLACVPYYDGLWAHPCCCKRHCYVLSVAVWHSIVYVHHIFLIHSSANGHLCCLHVLALVTPAAMNTGEDDDDEMMLVTHLCPPLCDPMHCSPPGPSAHGISQARILEWVVIPNSGSNLRFLYCRLILHCLSHQGSP